MAGSAAMDEGKAKEESAVQHGVAEVAPPASPNGLPKMVPPPTKSYHHGDLRRALIEAAALMVESEGTEGLTLRGVARAAGVSAAAPYHHFKDKQQLLESLGHEGFALQADFMRRARDQETEPLARLTSMGLAYVKFSHAHPQLALLMTDVARRNLISFDGDAPEGAAYRLLRESLIDVGIHDPTDPSVLDIASFAAWASAFGIAALSLLPKFDALKEAIGGEDIFLARAFAALGQLHGPHG